MPDKRYLGSFGAVGWATKSGTGMIRHDEKIGIERVKIAPRLGKGGRVRPITKKNQDVVVRFTNDRGDEVGRLESDSANWISSLMDHKLCSFEASCVYAPERIRTGDTIYLQLRCYFLRTAFVARIFNKEDDKADKGLFDHEESQDEKDLQQRQVGLVKLFEAINLNPTRLNETTEKHKRQGLLQAAEMAEKYDQKPKTKTGDPADPASSPPSDEKEEGAELEQDQLDSLYKKAQSFDFDTPELQPAETFSMDLRKYQKQALYWMVGKEKHEALTHKEAVMHPLWEEYEWPVQDADSQPLPVIDDQTMFYINPYSGEMSLEFPKQEQNCLGGVLADGK
jgi:DNA repair protein RAD5